MNPAPDPRSAPVALIAAGGSGERLGAEGPKALVDCAGRSLLAWTLEAFVHCRSVRHVVVAGRAAELARFEDELAPARAAGLQVSLCAGGSTRSHSVREALRVAMASDDPVASPEGIVAPDVVLVHDAARPLAGPALIDACVDGLLADGQADALVPAAPVSDTIKQADADGVVSATLDRSTLWAVQTPQAFRGAALAAALGLPPSAPVSDETIAAATDDASLIEAAGGRVVVLPWTDPNPKVTTQADLRLAAGLLAAGPPR
ncbi:MAG: 2-C-methyl-D-erythritol 4-phosphate cytidylyltransferase [Actinobacteria bacterium]|nr:2-C-methyl-D-erythritol 4-phosphate cytidylyltransferase [Actinomycetota bacterium]